MNYKCPCCGFFTFEEPLERSIGEICPVCYWEIDAFVKDEDKPSGANHGLSLNECRENYLRFGACAEKMSKFVRKPLTTELNREGKRGKFFLTGIKGGCYIEFAKGKWDGRTHWRDDTLFLDDDLFNALGLYRDVFSKVFEAFNCWGPNRVTRDDWERLQVLAEECGGAVKDMFAELTPWVEDNFSEFEEFWILGV